MLLLYVLSILSKPSLALRLFSSLQEVSPNSILSLNHAAKGEAKGSVSPLEGDTAERGLRQPRRSRGAAPLPGGESRAGAGQERARLPRDPPPPPPAPLALLKVSADPASLWDWSENNRFERRKENHLYRNKISPSGRWVPFNESCSDAPGCWQLRDHWCLLLQPRSANLCLCLQSER